MGFPSGNSIWICKNTLEWMCLETPHGNPSLFLVVYPFSYIGSSRSIILVQEGLFAVVSRSQSGLGSHCLYHTLCPSIPVLYQVVLGTGDEPMSVSSNLQLMSMINLLRRLRPHVSEEAALQSPIPIPVLHHSLKSEGENRRFKEGHEMGV